MRVLRGMAALVVLVVSVGVVPGVLARVGH